MFIGRFFVQLVIFNGFVKQIGTKQPFFAGL